MFRWSCSYLPLVFFGAVDCSPLAKCANNSVCCKRYFNRPCPLTFCHRYISLEYTFYEQLNERKGAPTSILTKIPCQLQWQHSVNPTCLVFSASSSSASLSTWPFRASRFHWLQPLPTGSIAELVSCKVNVLKILKTWKLLKHKHCYSLLSNSIRKFLSVSL